MTLKDKVAEVEPDKIDNAEEGGVRGCPCEYSYLPEAKKICDCCNLSCEDCWNQEYKPTKDSDPVAHPAHYETGKFECIDVMIETQGVEATQWFCILNAFKYLYRHNNKNGFEDIRKAQWYINKCIQLEDQKCDEKS